MTRLHALGGFDAKGPACFLLEMEGRRLLLDMGQGPDAGRLPDLEAAGRVDAVLVSHGHADHVGALAKLHRIGSPSVHATAPVRALAGDAALRGAADLPRAGEVAGLTVETGRAGHAPGAVWMRIGGAGGVLYSGDFAPASAVHATDPMPEAAAAVVDCSYGVSTATLPEQRAALLEAIGGGPCLLPAPPDGRALELAFACRDAGVEVRLCGQTRRVAEALIRHPEWLPEGTTERLQTLLSETAALDADAPLHGIMIAAGANCGSGLSQRLGPRALAAGVPVIFTGHLSAGSPAETWVAEGRARRLRWNVHPDMATLTAALDRIRPQVALAAFTPREGRLAVAEAFPGIGWSADGTLAW